MDGMGKQFLARTALSCDQDGGFGTGHLLGNVLYLPDRGAFSHDVVKDILGLMSFFQQLNPDFILPGFFFCEVPQDGNGTDSLLVIGSGYHIHIDGYPVDPDQPVPDGIAAGLISIPNGYEAPRSPHFSLWRLPMKCLESARPSGYI